MFWFLWEMYHISLRDCFWTKQRIWTMFCFHWEMHQDPTKLHLRSSLRSSMYGQIFLTWPKTELHLRRLRGHNGESFSLFPKWTTCGLISSSGHIWEREHQQGWDSFNPKCDAVWNGGGGGLPGECVWLEACPDVPVRLIWFETQWGSEEK